MSYSLIFPAYIFWHYTSALKDYVRIWTNFIWFFYNFFSIPVLFRTLFSPWQRIQEQRSRNKIDLEDIAEVVSINITMRIVGAVIRLVVIIFGCIVIFLTTVLGVALLVVWLCLPAVIVASFVYGMYIAYDVF